MKPIEQIERPALSEPTSPPPGADPLPDPLDVLPVPFVEVDAEGNIRRANLSACSAFGVTREEFLGRSGWDFVASDEVSRSRQEFEAVFQSDAEPEPVRRTLCSRNGAFRTYDLFRSVVRDPAGKPCGVRHVAVDVTETVVAQEEAERARIWLESVLDSLGEAVIITDALGFVRSANPAAEALTGWQRGEMAGKAIEKVIPILSYESADQTPMSHHILFERRMSGRATILDRKRYQLRVEIATAPIVDKENGYTTGIVRILRPLTEPQL